MTDLSQVAEQFQFPAKVDHIAAYGAGIINDTYVVTFSSPPSGPHQRLGKRAILQRINAAVFPQPENVMHNLQRVLQHVEQQQARSGQEQFLLPPIYLTRDGRSSFRDAQGYYWRALGFIENTATFDVLQHVGQAHEVGVALGLFHRLVGDIPLDELYDTLPGFHVTPSYLAAYDRTVADSGSGIFKQADAVECSACIADHRELAKVLVNASPPLTPRVMHGDPKLNNILFDDRTGKAVSIIDLDTVKPGLVHYDLGDCLRSCCNRSGEMPAQIDTVRFDLEVCEAILRGYLSAAAALLQQHEVDLIYDAIRLLPFELGLRFFHDHLQGNRYFKVKAPGDNLYRARVQFRLLLSIEAQQSFIRSMVQRVWADVNR